MSSNIASAPGLVDFHERDAIQPQRHQQPMSAAVLGSGDHDQDDEEQGPVARSTSDATSGTRSMPTFRSVVSVLVSFVGRSFSTNSRPALRAAASGGRPRAGSVAVVPGH